MSKMSKQEKAKYDKEYRLKNKEKLAARQKKYVEANKEQIAAQRKEYNQANKEKISLQNKKRANKEQSKKWHLKKKYNITLEQYNKMLEDQGNCCAICDEVMTQPCVDHNHNTGAVRELLCRPCNTVFGSFREDPRILEKAAMYARFHNGEV